MYLDQYVISYNYHNLLIKFDIYLLCNLFWSINIFNQLYHLQEALMRLDFSQLAEATTKADIH